MSSMRMLLAAVLFSFSAMAEPLEYEKPAVALADVVTWLGTAKPELLKQLSRVDNALGVCAASRETLEPVGQQEVARYRFVITGCRVARGNGSEPDVSITILSRVFHKRAGNIPTYSVEAVTHHGST